mmetsp:Transcript_23054/g.35576  ORF Transcript_23054/g.35576 Transcript_23054/m.35576 type:complete len:332 (-) Transcript_23054:1023-2018(-)
MLHMRRILSAVVDPTQVNYTETTFEFRFNIVLGLLFLAIMSISANRMAWSQKQGGSETTVVTAFYTLIFLTGLLRALWFLIPNDWLQPSYIPSAVMAFGSEPWVGTFVNSLIVTSGSLSLFFIFILILVYWADILKKYFHPGVRRPKPMGTFIHIVAVLVFIEMINYLLFLMQIYSSEGMVLFNSIVLAIVSIVCVIKITVFSQKFSAVLRTLGDINQVSTESQIKRIMWITVTGNLFFFARAVVEMKFAATLLYYYYQNGNVDEAFSHESWDTYLLIRHVTELMILFLMLYILQNKFDTRNRRGEGYTSVPSDDGPQVAVTGTESTNYIV